MNTLYLDCFAGVSGDMFLGALIDLGISPEELTTRLAELGLRNFQLLTKKTVKSGITATKAEVDLVEPEHRHRHLPEILSIIDTTGLPKQVKEKSKAVFYALAEAEGKIHNVPPQQVHFHEVGAVDAIVDIVGSVTALDLLGIEQLICSPLPLGRGFVKCAHGTLPLPAPAVLELLKGIPTQTCEILGETVTPTGAALVKTLAASFGPMPAMKIRATGYGAGQADREIPNLLRAVLGEAAETPRQSEAAGGFMTDRLHTIESNIDDMNPEFYDYVMELLFANGAVDVFITPVIMKKGRPGIVLTCLANESSLANIVEVLLSETTSLGVRTYPCLRSILARDTVSLETVYGPVRVKLGIHPRTGQVMNIAPEWEDCKLLAQQNRVPVKSIYDQAKAEILKNPRW